MIRAMVRAVPVLYWVAAVWVALSFWADDLRGVYIAAFCLLVGTVQLFRKEE